MATIEQAMGKIYNGDFFNGFSELACVYAVGEKDSSIVDDLKRGFWEPNLAEMEDTYHANVLFLSKYPFLFTKEFVPPIDNRYLLFPLTDELFYRFDQQEQRFAQMETNSDHETKYFFENLNQPLLIENEFNLYNLRFLQDNVRDSRDFGADNHIYLHYDSVQLFSLLLYYCDLSSICEEQKFVFLIGSESDLYPLAFQNQFGAETLNWEQRPLHVNDIKRVCAFYYTATHCGNAMFDSLLDCHPNLLTIKEFGLSSFPSFYENCLKNQSVDSFIANLVEHQAEEKYRPIFTFFQKIYPNSDAALPRAQDFLLQLRLSLDGIAIPTQRQWFVGFYLANTYALGRNMNSRITPTIFHALHDVWNNNAEVELRKMLNIYKDFPYVKIFSAVRRPDSRIAGEIKYKQKCQELYHLTNHDCLSYLFIYHGPWLTIDWRRSYFDEHAYFPFQQMAVLRYEDVKLAPKETLSSLCAFLNIPWADTLLHCTHNGAQTIYSDAGTVISDFDPAPLAPDYYRRYLNDFDRYRLELLYMDHYAAWGYQPQFYHGIAYDKNEMKSLFEIPFEFEGPSSSWLPGYSQRRKQILRQLDSLLEYIEDFGAKLRAGTIRTCQLLGPVQEEKPEV